MCWHAAPATLLEDAYVSAEAVARGLLFRVLTTNQVHRDHPYDAVLADEVRRYLTVVASLGFERAGYGARRGGEGSWSTVAKDDPTIGSICPGHGRYLLRLVRPGARLGSTVETSRLGQ